jgi:DNA-binding response OmpR family regulator
MTFDHTWNKGTQGGERSWVLFFSGRHVQASQRNIALLMCLYHEPGQVIPYERLCAIMGRTAGAASMHMLRQYMARIRQTLATNKSPYVLTVAPAVGYALCKMSARKRRR